MSYADSMEVKGWHYCYLRTSEALLAPNSLRSETSLGSRLQVWGAILLFLFNFIHHLYYKVLV